MLENLCLGGAVFSKLLRFHLDVMLICVVSTQNCAILQSYTDLFLKCCTLTNRAVGTIERVLSKPPQMRQVSDY